LIDNAATTDLSSADREAWLELGRQIGVRLEPRVVRGIDPSMTSTVIARDLVAMCGRRKAAWIRTRISQILEAEDGRRQGRRGRDRVRTESTGAAR
jgi:hypothetical protein